MTTRDSTAVVLDEDMDFAPAVLDPAHIGDIKGSLGSVSMRDHADGCSFKRRILTFTAIMGPGLIVMVGDNDAGGVQTYTQDRQRFGKAWAGFAVFDLFLLNFLMLLSELIVNSFGLGCFDVLKLLAVSVAGVMLFATAATGRFRWWERFMFAVILGHLVVVPVALLARPHRGSIGYHFGVPEVAGGISGSGILLIVAMVGTRVAPWQLFFQHSNVLDKRISPRWLDDEWLDTFAGGVLAALDAAGTIVFGAALYHSRAFGPSASCTDSGWFNHAIAVTLGPVAGGIEAVLVVLSSDLTISTLFAQINGAKPIEMCFAGAGALGVLLAPTILWARRWGRLGARRPDRRLTWRSRMAGLRRRKRELCRRVAA
ncbi:MAG: divalent metal cation transporter [Acidimicrobiales bacterium]